MSAERRLNPNPDASAEGQEWAPVPVVVDVNGDRLVTIHDESGRPHTRPVAELVLESFVGPRPPGHRAPVQGRRSPELRTGQP